eukprot:CAMPEP_0185034386 /NCGR_PEP_ID=MMETSP1103-20130426/24232_1 /TAXON_ID=36769 /ORGANISM="Paraphysomonas bandaiensis, Strain Caron Lab Isolate" /LENGTH=283 /DNA_ID=CAMNT_0027571027 /DNA_START=30 /DNA_END=878 /DNA_ORIENTATION=-
MALRREVRLRKEFLLRKEHESHTTQTLQKKRQLQEAINEGKPIPTEIRSQARKLEHDMALDVCPIDEDRNIDDEYANAAQREPKVCVSTSRDPSSRLKQFAKEVKVCIPNSQAVNRGNHRLDELVDAAKKADFTDIVLLNETRGQPDGMIISHLPFGPTAYFTLSNCVLRHDIPECTPASQAYPNIIVDNMSTKMGARIGRILQALYPAAKLDCKRVITYANRNDFISFRHHMYVKDRGNIQLKEAGPRFEMQPYEVKLGTLDQEHAESEWVLRPYMNTSRKK